MKCSTSTQRIQILFCFLQILTELVAVNVALGKGGKDCDGKPLPNKLFDGDKDVSATVSKMCPLTTFVEVFLEGQYTVDYVIVYEGKGDESYGDLNFFNVERKDKDAYEKCAEYGGLSKKNSNNGMRVNCHASIQLFSVVKIESRKNVGIKVAEIEVHTFGSGVPGERALINRGCFRKFSGHEITVGQPFFPRCQLQCANSGLILFGIKNNKVCICGSDYNEDLELTSAYCGMLCDDGKNLCGGEDAFTVYLSMPWLPSYAGCFETGNTKVKDIPNKLIVQTIPDCIKYCESYYYALLEEGGICTCTNKFGLDKPKYAICRSKCPGDETTNCGGKSHASVYRTCLKESYPSIKCPKLLRCRRLYDMFGSCHGTCQEGFLGEHCLERDKILSKKMTCEAVDPCLGIQNSDCVTKDGEAVCECKAGFVMNKAAKVCEDRIEKIAYQTTAITTTKKTATTKKTTTLKLTGDATTTKEAIADSTYTDHSTDAPKKSVLCHDKDKCIDVPHTTCVVVGEQEMCECEKGYSRRNPTDECEVGVSQNKTLTTRSRGNCNSPNACKDHPNTDCVTMNGNEVCECSLGYAKNKNSEHCQDIDECIENPCNSQSTTCINLNGTYYCECKPGFTRVTNEICLDNLSVYADRSVGELPIKRYVVMWFYTIFPLMSVFIFALIFWFHIPARSSESSDSDPTQSELYLYNLEQQRNKRKSFAFNLKKKKHSRQSSITRANSVINPPENMKNTNIL